MAVDMNRIEQRARELMLFPDEKAAYIRLLTIGGRTEFEIICPDCHSKFQSYETETLKHVRLCKLLRKEAN